MKFLFNFERIPTWLGWILETLWSGHASQYLRYFSSSLFWKNIGMKQFQISLGCAHITFVRVVAGFFNDRPALESRFLLFVGIIFIFTVKRERRPHFSFQSNMRNCDFDPTRIKEVLKFFRNFHQVENSSVSSHSDLTQLSTCQLFSVTVDAAWLIFCKQFLPIRTA